MQQKENRNQIKDNKIENLLIALSVIQEQIGMQLSMPERRCLQIFKAFVEKAFIPQIKQANGSMVEWNIFESLISAPNPNLNEIQYFVDTLSCGVNQKNDKVALSKKQQEIEQIAKQIFQLNKTFGGQKKRNSINALVEENNSHIRRQSGYEDIAKQQKFQTSSGFVNGFQKMLKSFEQNQIIIQNMLIEVEGPNIRNSRSVLSQLSYNGVINMNPPPHYTTQAYIQPMGQSKPLVSGYLRPIGNSII